MDVAVFADIHGNYIALKKCLDYALKRNITTFVFLGDYLGELAYPERTMEIIYEMREKYDCYFIRGNKEEYWLDNKSSVENVWKDKNSTTGALLYSYNHLTSVDLEFFSNLKLSEEITIGDMMTFTACHGSPFKIKDKMLKDDERTIEDIENTKTSLILCGHSHVQMKIVHNDKCVLNPGSVGMPLLSKGKSQFLILHGNDKTFTEEFITMDYDIDKVINDMHEAGLYEHAPYWTIVTENVLKDGATSQSKVLNKAMEICWKENGECNWPNIPEECWKKAVQEMIPSYES